MTQEATPLNPADEARHRVIGKVALEARNTGVAQALTTAYDEGVYEGKKQAYQHLLTLLESEYMTGDFKRGSVEAQAILHVTRKVGEDLRRLKK